LFDISITVITRRAQKRNQAIAQQD